MASEPAPMGAVPPQNLEAEESVLGAMMISPGAIVAVSEILDPADFYRESHALIYVAARELHGKGEPVDAITLTAYLEEAGKLDRAGGKVRIHELANLVPASANARHYATIVHEVAVMRDLITVGGQIAQLGWDREGDPAELVARAHEHLARLNDRAAPGRFNSDRANDGAEFILSQPATVPALWGRDDEVLWAEGEGLLIVGPDGVGKTTLMQQLVLARIGIGDKLLGFDIKPAEGKVLYIAADRPLQAARSFARMVNQSHADILRDKLVVWRGPLPFDPLVERRGLADMCAALGCTDAFVDSLKDIALDLTTDETGSRLNLAFQEAIASGIQLCAAHHQRKEGQHGSGGGKPNRLADVYGSRWLTAGMGSVLGLWAEPGHSVIELSHLKQPAEDVGPLEIIHDHTEGRTNLAAGTGPEEILQEFRSVGVTVREFTRRWLSVDEPDKNEKMKGYRKLRGFVDHNRAHTRNGYGSEDLYFPGPDPAAKTLEEQIDDDLFR